MLHSGILPHHTKWVKLFENLRYIVIDEIHSFLLTHDSAYAGQKPLRTYSGPRYLGGVSDHCPVLLRMVFY